MLQHLAVVSQSKKVKSADVAATAAAIQKQVSRDFGPIWQIDATVSYFEKLKDVPLGYWPVIIKDNIGEQGAGGVHLDDNKQPYALVQAENFWELAASHETLEMLADPTGNRLTTGTSPKKGQGRVQFLVEVCDPCEATAFGYHINGVLVSDFFTPHFYDAVLTAGARYSFTGAISHPLQVLKGGYLSWFDPVSKHWFQETFFGTKPAIKDLGQMRIEETIRGTFDRLRGQPVWHGEKRPKMDASAKSSRDASSAIAELWEASIAGLA